MITNLLKNCHRQFVHTIAAGILGLAIATTSTTMVMPVKAEAALATTSKVKVYLSGKTTASYHKAHNYKFENTKLNLGAAPILSINGYGMAPYTAALVLSGPRIKHSFNSSTGTLILKYNGTTVKMQNKSKVAYVNGKKVTLSQAPYFVKYATTKKKYFMVPINKTCQMLGLGYKYSSQDNTIVISRASKKQETKATAFKSMTPSQYIQLMGPLAQADARKTGVLASVTLAQSILESGWGSSELAQNANNLFGMKTSLSGNTWSGSAWDGVSKYTKKTGEEYSGKKVTIVADFRSYPSIEKSIADHSAYLLGAKNGYSLRYAGLKSAKNYREQIQIIKDGGYATSSNYVSSVCNLIQQYHLYDWD